MFFMPRRWFHGSSPGIWDCGGLRSFCPAVCPCSLLFGAFPFFPCLFPLFPLLLHSLPAAPSTCFSEPQDPWCQRSLLFLICALFCSPDFFRHGVQTCGSRCRRGMFFAPENAMSINGCTKKSMIVCNHWPGAALRGYTPYGSGFFRENGEELLCHSFRLTMR